MRKVLLLCAAGLIIFAPARAMANFKSGNDLYQGCSPDKSSGYELLSLGYVMGISDEIEDIQALKLTPPLVCIPPNVIAGQIRDIICKGLADNPQERQFSASSLTFKYLKTAFPCH